ncbi:tape measure protein [Jeotgalibaca porci]|uniref:tape measure protein n=1 Tax=Jeotgalibaca porci TaxID=1868793 RepID=UPI00359F46CB
MSDGRISIDMEVDGKQVKVASTDLDRLANSASSPKGPLNETEKALDGVSDKSKKAGVSIKDMVVSMGLVKIASAAFKLMAQSMDAAISRFDTMQRYPKVLSSLGYGAEESEASISKLADGIDGLPTKLDDVVASTQQLTAITGDLETFTDTVLALNNAFLASGASTADASRGTDQYIQMLSTGKVDLQSWKTLQETMPVALQKTAEAMGYTGTRAQRDLYDALNSGEITFRDFQNQLIDLGTGLGDLAGLAKENSKGIGTSFGNLRNAVAKNMANMITKADELTVALTGKTIAENLDSLKHIINASFESMGKAIDNVIPIIVGFKDGVKAVLPVIEALSPVIWGVVGAYVALKIIEKTNATIAASRAVWETMAVTTAKITALTNAKTAAELANNSVQAKYIAVNLASMKALTAKNIVVGLLTGSLTLSTAATLLKAKAVGVLSGALKLLSGPVGWVIVGIGLLVAAGVELWRWFKKSSEEGKKLTDQTDKLSSANDELTSSINGNADAHKKEQKNVQATADANSDLIKKIEELSSVEDKSNKQKKELSAYVDQLNNSMEGLNLNYSEEADMLSQSIPYLEQRAELMKEQETATAAQERMLEISKEQSLVDQKMEETNQLRADWNEKMEEGSVKSKEYKDAIAELDEQEVLLKETTTALAEEQKITEEVFSNSMEAISLATESSVQSQIISFADLSEAQQATIETMQQTWQSYKDAATNMFDTLSEESELTVAEMTANLEENQRVIGAWADNIAILASRGIDEGLLEQLRTAGPESAGYVNELVNASDEELNHLSTVFSEGGDVATEALATSLGVENNEVVDSVMHLVTQTGNTMKQEIEKADFGSIGKNVAAGLGDGIKEGTEDVAASAGEMADETIQSTKDAFDTHSPSRVYKSIGIDVTDGLALGVNEGTTKVVTAITDMFNKVKIDSTNNFNIITKNYRSGVLAIETELNKLPVVALKAMNVMHLRLVSGTTDQMGILRRHGENMTQPFATLNSRFYSIGLNSMLGLQSGLNSGRGSVMATARGIANDITATMQSALRINSPSKEMDEEVGRWVPEGVAQGIRNNAKSVYRELGHLATGMVKGGSPESALGLNGMTAMSAGETIFNNHTSTVQSAGTDMSRVERLLQSIASQQSTIVTDDGTVIGYYGPKLREENERVERSNAYGRGVSWA